MPHKDPEKRREYDRKKALGYYLKWKKAGRCVNCGAAEVVSSHKCQHCWDIAKRSAVAYVARLKAAAFAAYGGAVCACCGETEPAFLTIDHINGGGNKHRKSIAEGTGTSKMWIWLRNNGYPPGFQILCANCNFGRWRNGGVCPHKARAVDGERHTVNPRTSKPSSLRRSKRARC